MRVTRPTLLCVVLSATLWFATGAMADDIAGLAHTTPEQRASYQTELMTRLVDLKPAQVAPVQALNLEYAKQLDPVLKSSSSKWKRMEKARKILSKKDAAMKKALPPDQFKKYLDTKSTVQKELEAKFPAPADSKN